MVNLSLPEPEMTAHGTGETEIPDSTRCGICSSQGIAGIGRAFSARRFFRAGKLRKIGSVRDRITQNYLPAKLPRPEITPQSP
jgi:hypothetical protein